MQRILDIDLDFFLDRIFHCQDEPKRRLSSKEYRVEPIDEALAYLREHCGLAEAQPIPGEVCKHHKEVFFHWERMIRDGVLKTPFEVIHVDAHADMGLGNLSSLYIAEEFLAQPVKRRRVPRSKEPWALNNCNFILYALAMRWIGRLTYVTHPRCQDDVQWMHMKDFSSKSGFVQLKQFEPGLAERVKDPLDVKKFPFEAEPEVPMAVVPREEFRIDGRPDFVFISQSPTYTPREVDELFARAKKFTSPQLLPVG